MAKVRKIKGREGYFLDYRLKDSTRVIKKASRSNRRGAEKELALIVSEIETKPGLRRLKKTTVGLARSQLLGNLTQPHAFAPEPAGSVNVQCCALWPTKLFTLRLGSL